MGLKSNKRGVAVVFDWIFSIVAGVLVFSFLIYFAVQHTDLFGKVTARVVAEELDVLFSGYETAQVKAILDFGRRTELEFDCDNGVQHFKINGRDGKTFWDKIVFSPDLVEGEKIDVATFSWNVPFRAANFIYLWDRRYEFEDAPINFDFFEPQKIKNKVEKVKFSKPVNSNFNCDFAEKDTKTIYYDIKEGEYQGYVCFNGKDDTPVKFFGEAMMMGAIVTDKDNFICAKELINKKLEIMKRVFENKKNNLVTSNKFCNEDYSIIVGRIPTKVDQLDNYVFGFLKDKNTELIIKGCASVY